MISLKKECFLFLLIVFYSTLTVLCITTVFETFKTTLTENGWQNVQLKLVEAEHDQRGGRGHGVHLTGH